MRIRRLHIDGFGRFADRRLGPFERPVTVFLGPNEAGKSTLLEFVRRVLFGFRAARGRAPSGYNDYPPLAGGQHGGGVTIVSDAGEDRHRPAIPRDGRRVSQADCRLRRAVPRG